MTSLSAIKNTYLTTNSVYGDFASSQNRQGSASRVRPSKRPSTITPKPQSNPYIKFNALLSDTRKSERAATAAGFQGKNRQSAEGIGVSGKKFFEHTNKNQDSVGELLNPSKHGQKIVFPLPTGKKHFASRQQSSLGEILGGMKGAEVRRGGLVKVNGQGKVPSSPPRQTMPQSMVERWTSAPHYRSAFSNIGFGPTSASYALAGRVPV